MKRNVVQPTVAVLLMFVLSCSGSSGGPVGNDLVQPSEPTLTTELSGRGAGMNQGSAHLWGIWEIHVDPSSKTIEAVPLRGIAFTVNVTSFVDGPPSHLILNLGTIDAQPDYTDIPVDVGLEHPFPGLDLYTGFDVLGVFMGLGSDAYPGPSGFPVAGENDQRVLNPDGYTRWFNPPEFSDAGLQMALLGYTPGKLGSPGFMPTAELNPYRYFADGLEKDEDAFDFLVSSASDRGCFRPGGVNTRHYDLRFPSASGIAFQYAVVAHWENAGIPNPDLGDFPPEANSDEAAVIDIEDASTLYYDSGSFGGQVILDISPWDWSATCNESGVVGEYEIKCYSDAWTGAYMVDMTSVGGGEHYSTFHTEIAVDVLTSSDPMPVWIEVNYPLLDYTNELGVENDADGALASYFLHEVPVTDEIPAWIEVLVPNGGEEWVPETDEEITWDSYNVPGTVFIEYSNDNFVTDINTIANDETNDGSFMWTDIPCDISDVILVRISSTDNPDINDVSDENFSIIGSGWAQTSTGMYGEWGYGAGIDQDGNVYTTGSIYTIANYVDAFLMKYGACGDLLWEKTWGGIEMEEGNAIAVDPSGNVYVAGFFMGTADFDPGSGNEIYTSNGGYEVFVSKFDSSGTFQWARVWGGSGNDRGYGVAVDGSGDIYVTGSFFGGTVDFDPGSGTDNHTSNGLADVFLSKFDSSGDFQWARTWGASSNEYGRGVTADSSGSICVTGEFTGTVDFDPGSGVENHTYHGGRDVYVSKFNSSGDFQWAQTWGGNSLDHGGGVAIDGSGNVYITGWFYGNVDFDPGSGTDNQASNGGNDVFLSKLDSSGDYLWARTWGGTQGEYGGRRVAVDSTGNAWVTGDFFSSVVDFDPGSGIENHSPNGQDDAFLSKFDPSGEFQWVHTWGGTSFDEGRGVAVDESGTSYVAGWFRGSADFAPSDPACGNSPDVQNSDGYQDAFLLKHLSDGCW